ncbi:MAG: DNA repair protein RecO [Desulfovibrio sp.]
MQFSDRVLILRVGRFRETDLWVRFLSPKRGIMSAFAFGGSRSRRRFTGCLDVFNEVLFSIKTTRNGLYNALQEGVLLRAPSRLRTDWQRLGIAANCGKFIEAFGIAPDGAEKTHAFMRDILELLEDETPPPVNLPALFRVRVAFDQGYAMNLAACAECSAPLKGFPSAGFLVREGTFHCEACARRAGPGKFLVVGHETLDALAHVQEYSPLRWREGVLPHLAAQGHRDCARVIEAFIEHHVGLRWNSSRFVRV